MKLSEIISGEVINKANSAPVLPIINISNTLSGGVFSLFLQGQPMFPTGSIAGYDGMGTDKDNMPRPGVIRILMSLRDNDLNIDDLNYQEKEVVDILKQHELVIIDDNKIKISKHGVRYIGSFLNNLDWASFAPMTFSSGQSILWR